MKRFLLSLFFFAACAGTFAHAQAEFPYLAQVTEDNVNVRAGQAVSFESLGQLSKGAELVVVGKEYGWYKIKLPDAFKCFLSAKYVRLHNGNIGEITASRVNVRAGAGEKFTILGQLAKGTLVRVRNKADDWYEIEPLEGTYGWITEEFVQFKSKTIPPVKVVQIPSRNIYAQKKAIEAEARAKEEAQKAAAAPEKKKKEVFTVSGKIEQVDENDFCQEFRYKLVSGGITRYFLRAPDHILTQFSPYDVKIEGEVDTQNKQYPQPVLNVSRITFIL